MDIREISNLNAQLNIDKQFYAKFYLVETSKLSKHILNWKPKSLSGNLNFNYQEAMEN